MLSKWVKEQKSLRLLDKNFIGNSCKKSVWLNGWVFAYEVSGCGFQSSAVNQKLTTFKKSGNRTMGVSLF